MEERWKMLKTIHCLILSKSDQEIINKQESNKMIAMLKILLSLEIQSCEKFPSHCLHCHQLLALTVIKMAFDDTEPNSLHHFRISLINNFDAVLIKNLYSDDMYVSYLSQKVLLSLLKSSNCSNDQKTQLLNILTDNMQKDKIILETLTHAMSRRSGKELNSVCFSVIQKHLQKFMEIINYYPKEQNMQYMFYSLLQKILKFINQQPNDIELLQEIFSDSLLKHVENLFKMLVSKETKMSSRKLLDFFNTLMCYSVRLVLQKTVNIFYLNFAKTFIERLSKSKFSFNFETNSTGFMGQKISKPQQDSSLMRRMILICIKAFAVILKHGEDTDFDNVCGTMERCIININSSVKQSSESVNLEWLPLVFEDQDDSYIECVLCLLDINCSIMKRNPKSCIIELVDPYPVFFQFLETTDYDSSVIVDWLVSPETCFLLYISRFLKHVINHWPLFASAANSRYGNEYHGFKVKSESSDKTSQESAMGMSKTVATSVNCTGTSESITTTAGVHITDLSCGLSAIMTYSDSDEEGENNTSDQSNVPKDKTIQSEHDNASKSVASNSKEKSYNMCLDRVMSMLIRARMQIERLVDQDLFPYNPVPLLLLMKQCEDMYER